MNVLKQNHEANKKGNYKCPALHIFVTDTRNKIARAET